jgi:hypothetical protein
MLPWGDWFHCMGNTYGTWLPGDPRGFRTRHRKIDVPFDYKHRPPKGMYDELHDHSKKLMKRDAVYLETAAQRVRVCDEFSASLTRREFEIAILSVDRVHFHLLARFPLHDPRKWVGIAKRESSHYCKQIGDAPDGGIWAAACECKPIADRKHWQAARNYIADHAERGAALHQGTVRPALPIPTMPDLWDFDPNDLLIE